MVKIDPDPKHDSLLLEWIVKDKDGITVAYKMPNKEIQVIHKSSAITAVDDAIDELRKTFVKDIRKLLVIKFKLLDR